jgi:thiol-disulfide isomerase/thioredoxin
MSTNIIPTPSYLTSFNEKVNSNKYTIITILFLLILTFVIYYIYTKYYSTKLLDLYKPNNEKMPLWTKDNSNVVEIMFFFANWCPHCKTAKPEWEKTKAEYNNTEMDGYKIVFVDVDCTNPDSKTTTMMDKYNVEGYPTIILLKNNEVITYDAKVTYDHLVEFLKSAL